MPSQDVVVSSDKFRPQAGQTKYSLDSNKIWCAADEDVDNYIELFFKFVHNITGFAIGGDHRKDSSKSRKCLNGIRGRQLL